MAISWGLIISLLPVFGWSTYTWTQGESVCKFSFQKAKSLAMLLAVTCFLLPFAVMVTCYANVFLRLRRHTKTMKAWGLTSNSKPTSSTVQRMRREGRTTYFVLVILLIFTVCWVPFFVVAMLHINPALSVPTTLRLFSSWSTSANASVNPFVYFAMNSKFRRELFSIYESLKICRSRRVTAIEMIPQRPQRRSRSDQDDE